jgi:DNA topoisomerase-1
MRAAHAGVHAHHSIAGAYNAKKPVTITGTVRLFHFVNPHPWLEVDALDAGGEPHMWRMELDNRSELQAVGMDTTGRVQYKYLPKFSEKRQNKKYSKIVRFAEHLPELRARTNEHIALDGFPREKVLAVMMRLINSLYIRVGTEQSVKHYRTYGITTLANKHLTIGRGGKLIFDFVGKSHIKHRKVLVDEELASVMRDLKELGRAGKLFHYLDADGKPRPIKPADLNRYIKEITDPEFSAKDFRTWGGTLLAAVELADIGKAEDEKQIKKNLVRAVKHVAEQLGNTPTVCRGSYVHPAVIACYEKGITIEDFRPPASRRIRRIETDFDPEEKALLRMLREHTPQGAKASAAQTR